MKVGYQNAVRIFSEEYKLRKNNNESEEILQSIKKGIEGLESKQRETIDPVEKEVARGILASLSGLYLNLERREEEKEEPDPEKIRYYSEESKKFLQETQDFWKLDKKEIQKIFNEYGPLVKTLDKELGY